MKHILIILLLASCSKQAEIERCEIACCLSDKYKKDGTFIRTDTTWKDYVCGVNLEKTMMEPQRWFVICDQDSMIECRRYVIGNKITQPKKLK